MQLQEQSLASSNFTGNGLSLSRSGSLSDTCSLLCCKFPRYIRVLVARAAEQYNMHLSYTLAKRSG